MCHSKYGFQAVLAVAVASLSYGCNTEISVGLVPEDLSCGDLDPFLLADGGVGRDGIPALTDPMFFTTELQDETSYLSDGSRVIGVQVDGEWLAIPHNLMYRHEIVNLNRGSQQLAVTYCPLTGSALTFDRASVGGAEFGVSGLLFQSNLIMYDRNTDDSFWPQMFGDAACGSRQGQSLVRHPVMEMTWGGWQSLFPESMVVGVDLTDVDAYRVSPYGTAYESPGNGDFLGFPIPRDDMRRLPKERVLGFPAKGGQSPLAFPFLAMEEQGSVWVGEFQYGGEPAAVFWDQNRLAAVAVRPVAGGRNLTFRVEADAIVDNETGSQWSAVGQALAGPLEGEQLAMIPEAYVAFWTPWAAFHPGTELLVE